MDNLPWYEKYSHKKDRYGFCSYEIYIFLGIARLQYIIRIMQTIKLDKIINNDLDEQMLKLATT